MVAHFKKYSTKDLTLLNKELYSRKSIDEVVNKYRSKETMTNFADALFNKETRTAPKIK